ncbi:hypothetical protein JCM18899A_25000 [Nocardioides sp. AN3]
MAPWSAIVLAGGRAARLDGRDKASLEIGGRTLLDWALDAVAEAGEVVVVGDAVPTEGPVTFVRETPRYGGPAAGLLTGLDAMRTPPAYVAVVAVDMPRLTSVTLRRLVDAAADADGAVLVGPDGRRHLALVVSAQRLREIRLDSEGARNLALWRLLAPLELVDVQSTGDEHRDLDTWADLVDLGGGAGRAGGPEATGGGAGRAGEPEGMGGPETIGGPEGAMPAERETTRSDQDRSTSG